MIFRFREAVQGVVEPAWLPTAGFRGYGLHVGTWPEAADHFVRRRHDWVGRNEDRPRTPEEDVTRDAA